MISSWHPQHSIRNRFLFFVGFLLILTIAIGLTIPLYLINDSQRREQQNSISRAEQVLNSLVHSEIYRLKREAELLATLPIMKAVCASGDKDTIRDSARTFQDDLHLPLFFVFNQHHEIMARVGNFKLKPKALSNFNWSSILVAADDNRVHLSLLRIENSLFLISIAKIGIDDEGYLLLGSELGADFQNMVQRMTKAQVFFIFDQTFFDFNQNNSLRVPQLAILKDTQLSQERWSSENDEVIGISFPMTNLSPEFKQGRLGFSISKEEEKKIRSQLILLILIFGSLIFIVSGFLGAIVSNRITRPILTLTNTVKDILSSGDLSRRAKVVGSDEIAILGDSFNRLIEQIKASHDKLQDLNRNLEHLVEKRTMELKHLYFNMKTLLNNLDEAYLVFDQSGTIQDDASRIANDFFESTQVSGEKVQSLIGKYLNSPSEMQDWIDLVYMENADFDSFIELAPQSFWTQSPRRKLELKFRPIYSHTGSLSDEDLNDTSNSDGKLTKIICIATDKTLEYELQQQIKQEQNWTKMILTFLKQPQIFIDFCNVAIPSLQFIDHQISMTTPTSESELKSIDWTDIKRRLHTIKGGAAMIHIYDLSTSTHELESQLSEMNSLHDFEPLRSTFKNVKEAFAAAQNEFNKYQPKSLSEFEATIRPKEEALEFLKMIGREAGPRSNSYQFYLTHFILKSFDKAIEKYVLQIEHLSQQLQKNVEFKIESNAPLVYLPFYEGVTESMIHLFTNAMDHGIEPSDLRALTNKSPIGSITVSFKHLQSNEFQVVVSDDGRGLDYDRIRSKARKLGLVYGDSAKNLTDSEWAQFLFYPEFSTVDHVTAFSGRGVGLNALKVEVERLGGRIEVRSKKGEGSQFIITLPYVDDPSQFAIES